MWALIPFLIIGHSEGLGEGYDGDIAFASALEMFGGGHNDPISVAFGGFVILFSSFVAYANLAVLILLHARFNLVFYLCFYSFN